MVTTDDDNIVKGDITERDMAGNIRRFVEVSVERVESTVSGENARRSSILWPLALIVLCCVLLVAEGAVLAVLPLILLVAWVVGATR